MQNNFGRALLCAILWLGLASTAHAVCYVTVAGNSGNTGQSWSSPLDLHTALGSTACGEVWVAQGVYKPTALADPTISFRPRAGAAVYGGFAGSETARAQRDWVANLTILSGDIDGNDSINADGVTVQASDIVGSNAFNVVHLYGGATPIGPATVLDGFIITGGNAEPDSPGDGGGLNCDAFFSGSVCSPSLSNLVFSGNRAFRGGAMVLFADAGGISNPSLTNILFTGNLAYVGGALFVYGRNGESSPTLEKVSFHENVAELDGGAMRLVANSTFTMRNGSFIGNSAGAKGGAFISEGTGGYANLRFSNVTFHGNTASSQGGAIASYDSRSTTPGSSALLFENVTFSANNSTSEGKLFYSLYGETLTQTFRNTIIWGNGSSPQQTISQLFGGIPGTLIFDHVILQASCSGCTSTVNADPLLGPLADNGGGVLTRLPLQGSPAIGAGDNTVCADVGVAGEDARGLPRPQGLNCDLGAVEVQPGDAPLPIAIFANGFEP